MVKNNIGSMDFKDNNRLELNAQPRSIITPHGIKFSPEEICVIDAK